MSQMIIRLFHSFYSVHVNALHMFSCGDGCCQQAAWLFMTTVIHAHAHTHFYCPASGDIFT